MGLKLVPIGLLVLIALASQVNSQFGGWYNQKPARSPPSHQTPEEPIQKPNKPIQQEMQSKQSFGQKVTWRLPQIVIDPPSPGVEVALVTPPAPDSIRIRCGEQAVTLEVDMDFYKNGQNINPADMSMGGCPPVDVGPRSMLFQAELHACGSVALTTPEELIYLYSLMYVPKPFPGTSIVRTTGAIVGIECHYPRNHNVSSDALIPAWTPYSAVKQAEELLYFSLRLTTAEGQLRLTTQYFLGEMIYLEATVMQFYHVPLRVYVVGCVASSTQDPNLPQNYAFIENYGCMIDAKVTGSNSRFLPRNDNDDKLRFMMEAFQFQESPTDNGQQIYITCRLVATAAATPRDSQHKACSYIDGGWVAAGGPNDVCSCCDSSCAGGGGGGGQNQKQEGELYGEATIGPYYVEKKRP